MKILSHSWLDEPKPLPYDLRDKHLWTCSNCNTKIYYQDVLFCLVVSSRRFVDTKIGCPSCGHVDEPGKVRNYKS